VLCYGGERLPEALGLVQKAMRLNPHYPVSYLSALALAYYFLGRQEEAVMTLQRALVRDPDHEVAHFFLAILYREEGKIEAARAELQACAELTPQDSLENVIQRLPIRNASLLERWQNLLRDIWPQLHEASG
jgi:tetratricopeptide (TPR) repeat protein